MVNITIIKLDDSVYEFTVEDTLTILEFKQRISFAINVDVSDQRMIFDSKVLKDDWILGQIGIDGKTVYLVHEALGPNTPGRAPASNTAPDIPDCQHCHSRLSVIRSAPGFRRESPVDDDIIYSPDPMESREIIINNEINEHHNRLCLDMLRTCNKILRRLENPLISGISRSNLVHPGLQHAEDESTTAALDDRSRFLGILRQLFRLNIRLQPFYYRYIEYSIVDPLHLPQFSSNEELQRARNIYDGVSDVIVNLSNIYQIISVWGNSFNLPPYFPLYHNGPFPHAAQQPTYTRPGTVDRYIPVVRAFRPEFTQPEGAGNAFSNASSLGTRVDTNNRNTEYSYASPDYSTETMHGLDRMHYRFEHTPGTTEAEFVTSNTSRSRQHTAFSHWSDQRNDQVSSGVRSPSMSDQPIGSASTGDLDHGYNNIPIGDIPYFRDLEGQFILSDLFLLIARNWTFHDMFNFDNNNIRSTVVQNPISGNAQRIGNFFRHRIMHFEPTEQNIEEARNHIFLEMLPYINILHRLDNQTHHSSIEDDIYVSFRACIYRNLRKIVDCTFQNRTVASNEIVAELTTFVKELLELVIQICVNQDGFEASIAELMQFLSLPNTIRRIVTNGIISNIDRYPNIIADLSTMYSRASTDNVMSDESDHIDIDNEDQYSYQLEGTPRKQRKMD